MVMEINIYKLVSPEKWFFQETLINDLDNLVPAARTGNNPYRAPGLFEIFRQQLDYGGVSLTLMRRRLGFYQVNTIFLSYFLYPGAGFYFNRYLQASSPMRPFRYGDSSFTGRIIFDSGSRLRQYTRI